MKNKPCRPPKGTKDCTFHWLLGRPMYADIVAEWYRGEWNYTTGVAETPKSAGRTHIYGEPVRPPKRRASKTKGA